MVLVVGLVLMAVLSWQVAGSLSGSVTFVGTGPDGADQHAPKSLVLSGMPLLTLVIAAVLLASHRLRRFTADAVKVSPWRDDRTHRKAVDLALGVLVPVLLGLHLVVLRAADGRAGAGVGYLAAAVAFVVIGVGNFWPKQVPVVPAVLAARLDATTRQGLQDGLEAQRRNLRPAGVVMVLLGLVALACSWLVPMVSLGVSFSAVLAVAGIVSATAWRSAVSRH
ncbi:hypothetical protein Q0Z83_031970 [Actinoplanes sichuanensis]|nr:hypothetical protein Q0Z83_031970 [Actinoplanes sichuanensis]